MVSRYWENDYGVTISNLDFSNLQLYARRPFCIKLDDKSTLQPPCSKRIGCIRFSNVSGGAELSSYLSGTPEGALENIRFDNVSLHYGGKGPAPDLDEHGHWGCSSTAAAFELAYVNEICFSETEISWEKNSSGWKHDICGSKCKALKNVNCNFTKGICEKR